MIPWAKVTWVSDKTKKRACGQEEGLANKTSTEADGGEAETDGGEAPKQVGSGPIRFRFHSVPAGLSWAKVIMNCIVMSTIEVFGHRPILEVSLMI